MGQFGMSNKISFNLSKTQQLQIMKGRHLLKTYVLKITWVLERLANLQVQF